LGRQIFVRVRLRKLGHHLAARLDEPPQHEKLRMFEKRSHNCQEQAWRERQSVDEEGRVSKKEFRATQIQTRKRNDMKLNSKDKAVLGSAKLEIVKQRLALDAVIKALPDGWDKRMLTEAADKLKKAEEKLDTYLTFVPQAT
jgi:hypothetical protein